MATGCVHPYGGRVPRGPFWKDRRDGSIQGPSYVALSDTVSSSATDPGDSTRAANKTAILAAVASARTQGKALLVDGTFWWDGGTSGNGLDLSADGVKIIGRTLQCFPDKDIGMDGFVGKVSSAPASPKAGLYFVGTTGQEAWNIKSIASGATERGNGSWGQHGITGSTVSGFRVVGCYFSGHAATSMQLDLVSDDVYVARCIAGATFADAYHFDTTSNLYVENCLADGPADDYYAVIGYGAIGSANSPRNITMRNCHGVRQSTGGSIVAVVGGSNMLFESMTAATCAGKGFRVSSESAYSTGAVDDIAISNCSVGTCGTSGGNANNAFILYTDTAHTVTNVSFDNCKVGKISDSSIAYLFSTAGISNITFTDCSAPSQVSGLSISGGADNITFDGCTIASTGTASSAVSISSASASSITLTGCTITGTGGSGSQGGVTISAAATGIIVEDCTISISGAGGSGVQITGAANCTINDCTITAGSSGSASAILITGGGSNLTITDNTILGASQYGIRIATTSPSGDTLISGNTISNIAITGVEPDGFIDAISLAVNQTTGTITISGNTHDNTAGNEYHWDFDISGQADTLSALICTNNVRGPGTGDPPGNYAIGTGQDAGTGIRIRDPDPGWTISGNT